MPYTAAALTAAASPVVLTIGDVSHRRGLRRVSLWWVRRFRTWTAKPLSVPQMLQLQAARVDPLQYLLTLMVVLRQVMPARWWYRLTGDPVTLILRLPDELRKLVLLALVATPGSTADQTEAEESIIEQIRREQREASYGKGGARGSLSLASATLAVRETYGDAWYWSPNRWPTSDGYVPFAVALLEFEGVQALSARRRLEMADGFSLAQAKEPRRARQQLERMAYPAEVC